MNEDLVVAMAEKIEKLDEIQQDLLRLPKIIVQLESKVDY